MFNSVCAAEGKIPHGPLRLIFTTAEETDKNGAVNIDKKYLTDVKYAINLDNEESNTLLVSSAAQTEYTFTAPVELQKPTKNRAYKININGLKGGHSGVDINKNRINAILAMSNLLEFFKANNIDFEYIDFLAGEVSNAIPPKAEITLVSDSDKINEVCENFQKEHKEK